MRQAIDRQRQPIISVTPLRHHGGMDVAVVVEGCQLVFALDGRSVALPEKACTGELHAGDQLLWHADDGALYAFDAALAITELGSADDIAWHPQSGLWTIAVGTEITARKAGVDLWTWKHTDPLLHVFPLGARIGLWDAGGTVHALDVNGTASTELKWIGTEGEAIGSPDGVSLYIQRENGMLVVTL